MQNFHSKASKLAKIQFFKSYFFQKFSSLSPIFSKESVPFAPIFGAYPFFKPPSSALTKIPKYQVEYPLCGNMLRPK